MSGFRDRSRRLARRAGLRRRATVPQLPSNPKSVPPADAYSPHLAFATSQQVAADAIREHVRRIRTGRFLDVGGRGGEFAFLAGPLEYFLLDIDPTATGSNVIRGDICDCREIADASFDVVFSNSTFEHIGEPWRAARETGRILKDGGLSVCITLFAWRYHPSPNDYWRFTHSALELLFEKHGGLETVASGYDLRARRDNKVGGKVAGGLDRAPVDSLGGWRENWIVYHVGRKPQAR